MTNKGTTIATWAGAIAQALEAQNISSAKVFTCVGLDIEQTTDPHARFAVSDMAKLWKAGVLATDNPALGLVVPNYLSLSTFHGLGPALGATGNVQGFLERIIRFSPMVSNVAEMKYFSRAGDLCVLQWYIPAKVREGIADEALDAFISLFVKQSMREELKEVHLIRPEPKDPGPWGEAFACPIHFNADMDAVVFPRSLLDKKLGIDNPALARACDEVSLEYIRGLERDNIVMQVENEIRHRLKDGEPKQQDVAQSLCLSVRNLQRRLAVENTRYALLLKEVRQSLARDYLRDPNRSIMEISLNLGFSDQSNFASAFRRWEGVSPTEFREQKNLTL